MVQRQPKVRMYYVLEDGTVLGTGATAAEAIANAAAKYADDAYVDEELGITLQAIVQNLVENYDLILTKQVEQ